MKRLLMLWLICCFLVVPSVAQTSVQQKYLRYTYELYSWRGPEGGWNFCLLYTTNRTKTPEEVFANKTALHGVAAIQKTIDRLPSKSRIVWMNQAIWGIKKEGIYALEYPPAAIANEVTHHAESRGITVLKQ